MKLRFLSSNLSRILCGFLFSVTPLMPSFAAANESFGFLERFALADDRGAVIKELIPGTEEFYYYSSLHALQEGRFDDVTALLEPWIKRHGNTQRVTEIEHRRALLSYGESAEASLEYLVQELNLRFNHERATLDQKPDFPTALDPELITWESFLQRSLGVNSLAKIKTSGLDRLVRDEIPLNPAQRRELLSRLVFPDFERLVGLIAADLRTPESRGFGEFQIHRQLTLAQLDELAGLMPELATNSRFVDARLLRLRPGGDVLLEHSTEERIAYLDRLWEYVGQLNPAFNSLKASVLYQKLSEARKNGEFPLDDFMDYLRLPRPAPYMLPRYLQQNEQRNAMADLNADFSATTGFPPIGGDEPLVRHFLEAAFVEDESYQRFTPFVDEDYLKQVFAETKLTLGLGDAADYFSMLTPEQVEAVRERTEISLAPDNPDTFTGEDEVSLSVVLKNVPELIVKVYEINAHNYYLDQQREISTDLNLDGLVANEEKRYQHDEPSVIRHEKSLTFESMQGKRGIWVVEMIGNGISSRALVRKGKLQYLSTTTPGGELIQVLSEDNEWIKDATAFFGNRQYDSDEGGSILLPFSSDGRASVILSDGIISSLVNIELPREEYSLEAGFFLEQESLIAGRETSVSVRPQLSLHGEPVSVTLLENTKLRIQTTDADGIESLVEVEGFELFDSQESVHRFQVPNRLQRIEVSLEGELPLVSEEDETPLLTSSREFLVNGTDTQNQVFDLFLSRFDEGYRIDVLGKSGEPIAERPVSLVLTHQYSSQPYSLVLKSDPNGQVNLGPLSGISFLTAQSEGATRRDWRIQNGKYSHAGSIHAKTGEPVVVPVSDPLEALTRSDLAVFELRAGVPVADRFDAASRGDGAIVLTGLDRGDYRVVLRGEGKVIDLHVTEPTAEAAGYALSESRHLQLSDPSPLHLMAMEREGDQLVVHVANADAFTRVHLIATRFLPEIDPYDSLMREEEMPLFRITRGSNRSLYLSGRDIGEEYRYILERRNLARYPGNMLDRPGLLLNPWELNETETNVDEAEAGEDYRKGAAMKEAGRARPAAVPDMEPMEEAMVVLAPAFQFLKQPSLVLANLEVGKEGTVKLDASLLEGRQHVQVVALNSTTSASRQFAMPTPEETDSFRDLRLTESLDSAKAFTQQNQVTLLAAGETLEINDLRSTEMEVYDTLGAVYSVLLSINGDADFMKFGFITSWSQKEVAEKRRLYSEFACHELNLFLAKKDPDFFQETVLPYLSNKKDKTFMDLYLLGENLEAFLQPWAFSRLNIVERILLGQRLGGTLRESTANHVVSLHELIPNDVGEEVYLFSQALRGRRAGGSDLDVNVAVAASGFAFDDADGFADMGRPAIASTPSVRNEIVALSSRGMAKAGGIEDKIPHFRELALEQRLFRQIESTKEWAENNYYELPIREQLADLVTVNGFWKDFANWDGEGGFYSRDFTAATENFTEMMLALSVMDLPFEAIEHEIELDDAKMTFTAKSPVILFHQEIQEGERAEGETPVLVSQNFYRANDRFRMVNGQREDKFVTDEFLTGVIYGSQIVVTNPTSSRHRLDLLVQIPQGAVPVAESDYTKSYPFALNPFSTEKLEVSFYFPEVSGNDPFTGYPVQVAKDEQVIASGTTASFEVVERLTEVDETSWDYLSQEGTEKQVLDYLKNENLELIDLGRIAWRMKENVDFFKAATQLIAERHAYDNVLWSYGLYHGVPGVAREYLNHQEGLLNASGLWIESELVSIDPVDRHWHEHLEYSPLVNARSHRLGKERSILNDRFLEQYRSQLKVLTYKPSLSAEDRLSITAYLFLQDRIEEGLAWQETVNVDEISSKLQFDYLSAYAAFYREDLDVAAELAANYEDYPIDRWNERFATVAQQILEIGGGGAGDSEPGSIEKLSSTDPFLDLTTLDREAELTFRNLDTVTVNYYEMDLEFLFSSNPFVSGGGGQFAYIRPNLSEEKSLPDVGNRFAFEIPEVFASKNVLVEVVGAGQRETVAVYSNQLDVELSERYGRLKVALEGEDEALPKTYIKVYAKMKDGSVKFFKDGYTDLRGKFDYAGLSTNELDEVEKMSLLVMSEEQGSLVKEVAPPKR
ncbi:MAG: hypothetical protein P1U58_13930 [Verrucomicrobiales bacterium]|nr:hypothetical protein [Verrucomicrobiales bacterium]